MRGLFRGRPRVLLFLKSSGDSAMGTFRIIGLLFRSGEIGEHSSIKGGDVWVSECSIVLAVINFGD
jgi:hypothetical protein